MESTKSESVAEQGLRTAFVKAIAKGITEGLGTGPIIVTILELTRVSLEGALLACHAADRVKLTAHLVQILQEMAQHLKTFDSNVDTAELMRAGQQELDKVAPIGWDAKKEIIH